ncbi:alpha/beta fold hydrolase [Dysgonomonas sp. 521]|uniref:alpha/beta fold hydrolase n=1 Tax=Dysgonomonas sp. 521 TaxID=2302932 RepID=UPI0013D3FF2A|nr:alpha/beta hydrolase [Dysgonomonas sp. 521]
MAQDSENNNIKYFLNEGRKISYRDSGYGSATIVLVSGGTLGLETWKDFQELLSKYARVISYDRSGLGNSDYVPNSKSINYLTAELDAVINNLDIDTPVILVGHSIGGYIVRKYAELYANKVKSLFLIDTYHDLFFKELKSSLKEEAWNDYVGNIINARDNTPVGISDEFDFQLKLLESDDKYSIPLNIPVFLFTSIKETPIEEKFVEFNKMAFKVHLELNNQLAEKYGNLRHIVTNKSSHFIYLDEPELIINEMLNLIDNNFQK